MKFLREWGALAVGYMGLVAAIVFIPPQVVARFLAHLTN